MSDKSGQPNTTILVMFVLVCVTCGLVLKREGYDVGWHHAPAILAGMVAVIVVGGLLFAALEWIAGFMARRGWGGGPR